MYHAEKLFDYFQFECFKIKRMEKCNFMEWKNKLVKTIQGDEGGPVASNLRREGV